MQGRGGRCTVHDLAVGPDGLCVLCRRSAAASTDETGLEGSRARTWALRFAGLALIVAAFGYGATRLGRRTPAVAAAETAPQSNAATEALVGRQPPLNTPPAAAPRTTVSGSDHAVPFSIAETPTFATRTVRSNDVDAGSGRPGQKAGSNAAREPNAPRSEEELRSAMRRVSVTVYSTDWCPVCTKARAWLRANGVSFEERDVDKSETARRMQLSLNPKGGVPTIDIDGEVMIGFGAQHMQEALRRAAERRARKF